MKRTAFRETVRAFESELISGALENADRNIAAAARLLGTSPQSLANMLKGRHKNLAEKYSVAFVRRRKSIPTKRARPRRDDEGDWDKPAL